MIDAAVSMRASWRILVVEDNADTAASMAKLLELNGHEVRVALDGPRAIETAVGWRPDFILLDLGLPGMDGYEVAERVRREETCRHTIIFAVTGYGLPEARDRSRVAGIDRHLLKPVELSELLALMTKPGSAPQPETKLTGRDDPPAPPAVGFWAVERRGSAETSGRAIAPCLAPDRSPV